MKSLPLFLIFVCALLASCLNEEGYTTSADARLRLERDTLALDTVLAGEATNTYTFQVFNPQKKTLRIAAIRLAGGAAVIAYACLCNSMPRLQRLYRRRHSKIACCSCWKTEQNNKCCSRRRHKV